jgi:hypothetical protein
VPMPFDATMKNLAAGFPRDFVTAFDAETTRPVAVLNVDLSTVTTSTDFVVGLGEPPEELLHIDFQSSADEGKHADVLVYNALLHRQYRVPVHSIALLLRPAAAHSNLSGAVSYAPSAGRGRMQFEYQVVKLWERPAEELLAGGLGTAALAMLGRLARRRGRSRGVNRRRSAADPADGRRGFARAGEEPAHGGLRADRAACVEGRQSPGVRGSESHARIGHVHGDS